MRSSISWAVILLAAIVLTAVCAVPASIAAKEPKAGILDFYDHSVGGEPGEDPHLRTGSDLPVHYIEYGGHCEYGEAGAKPNRLIDGRRTLEGMPPGLRSRSKWRVMVHLWLLSIVWR